MEGERLKLNDSQHVSIAEAPDTQAVIGAGKSSPTQYLEGVRLHGITATYVPLRLPPNLLSRPNAIQRLCLCLFLTNLEIPIVSTSLVSIAGDLGALEKLYWITTAYMLGYAGMSFLYKPSG
jgi:hypothetical protein